MLLNVLDSAGVAQKVVVAGQEAVVDRSGSIALSDVAQTAIAANVYRSGFFIQNKGANPMYINELGTATAVGGSITIPAGASFPPAGYPVSTGAISILGTAGDIYTAREW